ncbi:unnamed protein product [Pieris brassicae]|uniref:Reverse transcriptase domain-containing protein n=1 Tax=Pieris brassicae TaxID=7116 RepID=A0A9P0TKD9_PIEBR|nr:unnamed protein product [Pieris brassicae]
MVKHTVGRVQVGMRGRQGGLTSTALFNLYINELIEALGGARVGCSINGHCMNSISYADDMVLLSPSVGALRRLLSICERYAESHGLRYNVKKVNCSSLSQQRKNRLMCHQ